MMYSVYMISHGPSAVEWCIVYSVYSGMMYHQMRCVFNSSVARIEHGWARDDYRNLLLGENTNLPAKPRYESATAEIWKFCDISHGCWMQLSEIRFYFDDLKTFQDTSHSTRRKSIDGVWISNVPLRSTTLIISALSSQCTPETSFIQNCGF